MGWLDAQGTRELVEGLADPRVRILDTVWDFSRGSEALSVETNRAMAACRGSWGVYIQADEVLHEAGVPMLRDAVRAADGYPLVEGLLVDYVHFYGDFDTVATDRHWYRREVRVVRLGGEVRSYGDAQGFRVGVALRRPRARASGARMFHYGWARSPGRGVRSSWRRRRFSPRPSKRRKRARRSWRSSGGRCCARSPALTARRAAVDRGTAGRSGRARGGAAPVPAGTCGLYVSDWIERLTGARPFEYRNYVQV
jgi:hypothetical protein